MLFKIFYIVFSIVKISIRFKLHNRIIHLKLVQVNNNEVTYLDMLRHKNIPVSSNDFFLFKSTHDIIIFYIMTHVISLPLALTGDCFIIALLSLWFGTYSVSLTKLCYLIISPLNPKSNHTWHWHWSLMTSSDTFANLFILTSYKKYLTAYF